MPHRTFKDSVGHVWQVWSVTPSRVERRSATGVARPPGGIERRVRNETRVTLGAEWTNGWLVFESTDEKRRLSRYPDDWSAMSDDGLRNLLHTAKLVSPSHSPGLRMRMNSQRPSPHPD